MKKIPFLICLLFGMLSIPFTKAQYGVEDIYAYINQYKDLALNQMYEYKIPASITLAQGIFESACGTSRLATVGNNHFGVKCHKEWTGDTILIDDDELQECFRKYSHVEESYRDHSLFLTQRPRYSSLFSLEITDYKAWARGLKAAGYATDPTYADRLIRLIETYHIAQYDTLYLNRLNQGYYANYPDINVNLESTPPKHSEANNENTTLAFNPSEQKSKQEKVSHSTQHSGTQHSNTPPPAPQPTKTTPKVEIEEVASEIAEPENKPTAITVFSAQPNDYPTVEYPFTERPVYSNNNTYFVIAQKGDNYAKIARDVQSTEKKLKSYNDVTGSAKLKVGQVVYIGRKSAKGAVEYYKVVNAESLLYIAQKTGVMLQKICKYNNMSPNQKLKKNDIIKLKK